MCQAHLSARDRGRKRDVVWRAVSTRDRSGGGGPEPAHSAGKGEGVDVAVDWAALAPGERGGRTGAS